MTHESSRTDGYRPRQDPELAEAFAKDPADEQFLERLNEILAPHADADLQDLEERFPTLHLVGAPRSGTTLLYQLVASGLEVGYVNHLVAATWRAPVYGVRLARKLGIDRPSSTFRSSFGRTHAVDEPHEFGYFWNDQLRYPDLSERPPGHEDTIDWAHLRRVLVNMAHANGAPMAFKPMLLIWHLETMLEHMPRTCYVWIRRDPKQTALSLLAMRRSLFGSYEQWASLRPREPRSLADEPPWRQVAAQVVLLERVLEQAYERLGPEHMLAIRYEELCADPRATLGRIRDLLGSKGFAPALREVELPPFAERHGELQEEFGGRVGQAIDHFSAAFGELAPAGDAT